MSDPRGIVHYKVEEHGHIKLKLSAVMKERGVTRNRLRSLTGVKYDVIDRYYKGNSVERADLDFFAKVCYVLNCKIEDLLEFVPPEE